jgi:hypothetical protein
MCFSQQEEPSEELSIHHMSDISNTEYTAITHGEVSCWVDTTVFTFGGVTNKMLDANITCPLNPSRSNFIRRDIFETSLHF